MSKKRKQLRNQRNQRCRANKPRVGYDALETRRMLAGMSSTSDINDEICETGLTLLDGQTRTGTILSLIHI